MTGPAATDRRWTTRELLAWMATSFRDHGIESPRLVAEHLLAHVLGCERMRLYMEVDRPASPDEREALRSLVRRALRHEPVQYLVGHWGFFGLEIEVAPSTLIPRPSTEVLVEQVLEHLGRRPDAAGPPAIVEIGTGTGCVAVSLAVRRPDARIVATDIVPDALELAGRNADRHAVGDRVERRLGPLYEPLAGPAGGERFDVVCANPPYVSDAEWPDLEPIVREHEPASALRGGADGLDVIRPLVAGAPDHLRPGGLLALEIGHAQRDPALALAAAAGLREAEVVRDYDGLWRVLLARGA
ncbi:MAG: peptide chain release factor N(5)-glutamine methyltransferase [Planctomycetota bacterium]|jgi:release factor glutamine methyltransferase